MRCARLSIPVAVLAAIVTLSGCSTAVPRATEAERIPQQTAGRKVASTPQDPAQQREFDLALRAMKAGRDKDAERMLRQIVATNPELPGPHANLGIVCLRSGRLPEAEAALVRAVSLDSGNASLHNLLGIVYRNAGKFSDAYKSYEAALRLRPDYAMAHLNIGILYDLYLNNNGKALEHYQKFQQLQPGDNQQVDKWIIELKQRSQRAANNG